MTDNNLVLSIFPGIDLLGRAFEETGYCVVRGPDLLWGGDIRTFHPPCGVFAGVIGGPPCQDFSALAGINRKLGREPKYGNLIPEFERVVVEAQPVWFVMENVPRAPEPHVWGYLSQSAQFNNRLFGAEQNRERVISIGFRGRPSCVLHDVVDEWSSINGIYEPAVVSTTGWMISNGGQYKKSAAAIERLTVSRKRPVGRLAELQGLPPTILDDAPFTVEGKRQVIANGVPLPMGRAIARAVRRALETASDRKN